jgi:hypothetical protein
VTGAGEKRAPRCGRGDGTQGSGLRALPCRREGVLGKEAVGVRTHGGGGLLLHVLPAVPSERPVSELFPSLPWPAPAEHCWVTTRLPHQPAGPRRVSDGLSEGAAATSVASLPHPGPFHVSALIAACWTPRFPAFSRTVYKHRPVACSCGKSAHPCS